jgi:hypothetical protein
VEKEMGGFIHSYERGELGVLGESEFTVEFTVHRGAEEVLGSEG